MIIKSDLLLNINQVTWSFSKQPILKLSSHQKSLTTNIMAHSKSSKRKDLHHTISNWTNHGSEFTLSSTSVFFTPITKANVLLKNKYLHLLPKSSLVLKKPKWNTSLTWNASKTQFTISYTRKDSHEKKMNGFLLKNLPMPKWQSKNSIVQILTHLDLPSKSGK